MNVTSLVSPQNVKVLVDMAKDTPPGIFIEVGVYKGGTAYHLNEIVKKRGYEFWLFDTFEGMPESTAGLDSHPIGDFADCSEQAVQKLIPNAKIFKGFFPSTLPSKIPPIAFAHIDCDQYESIKQCIIHLIPRMVIGGIMYFDDYGCLDGATKAIDEFCPLRTILENGKAYYVKR